MVLTFLPARTSRLLRFAFHSDEWEEAGSSIVLRDRSSTTWFQTGDKVLVIDDVEKMHTSLKGRRGTVIETWEKCEVDPTCCCAEQVDPGMAVRVQFQGSLEEGDRLDNATFFDHYFAEAELLKVDSLCETNPAPFDGMSCVDFKLGQLAHGGQLPRSIFSYEPEQSPEG